MITMTRQRSRPAEEPQARINAEAEILARRAEVRLLCALLQRCDAYLEAVAQEARIEGEADAYAEGLRRDIRLALFDS